MLFFSKDVIPKPLNIYAHRTCLNAEEDDAGNALQGQNKTLQSEIDKHKKQLERHKQKVRHVLLPPEHLVERMDGLNFFIMAGINAFGDIQRGLKPHFL